MKQILVAIILLFSVAYVSAAPGKVKATKSVLTAEYIKALGFGGQKAVKKSAGVWTLRDGVTVYSTDAYGAKIRGYAGPTPLFIAVSNKGKIISIAAAPNSESPEYFEQVLESALLTKWNGKTLKEASTFRPDAVTGATYSSFAIIRTVNVASKQLSEKK